MGKEVQSWLEMNPSYRYERITQANDMSYVRERFIHEDLFNTALQLKDGMLRADLIQYAFLLAEGGIYTDIDTVCLKPIDSWIPEQFARQTNLVLGIEGDCLGGDIIPGFSHCVQFATWTVSCPFEDLGPAPCNLTGPAENFQMMVKPGHFIMETILDHVSVLPIWVSTLEIQDRFWISRPRSSKPSLDGAGHVLC